MDLADISVELPDGCVEMSDLEISSQGFQLKRPQILVQNVLNNYVGPRIIKDVQMGGSKKRLILTVKQVAIEDVKSKRLQAENDQLRVQISRLKECNREFDLALKSALEPKEIVGLEALKKPWQFRDVEKYRFYVCPECFRVHKSVELFQSHARLYHPLSRQALGPWKWSKRGATNDCGSVVDRVSVDECQDYDVDMRAKQKEMSLEKEARRGGKPPLLSGDNEESRVFTTATRKEDGKSNDSDDAKVTEDYDGDNGKFAWEEDKPKEFVGLEALKKPWKFRDVEKYRFYVCPECFRVHRSVELFLSHARLYHPLSRQVLGPCKRSKRRNVKNDDVNRVSGDTVAKQKEKEVGDKPKVRLGKYVKNPPAHMLQCYNYELSGDKESRVFTRTPKEDGKNTDSEDENVDLTVVHHLEDCGDNPEGKFQCYTCGKDLSPGTLINVLEHCQRYHGLFNTIHYGKPRHIECVSCGATFVTSDEAYQHRAEGHDNPTFQCSHCGKLYTCKSRFERHLSKVTDAGCYVPHVGGALRPKKIFKCDECALVCSTFWQRTRHMFKVHQKPLPYSCIKCGKMFVTQTEVDKHVDSHHNEAGKMEQCHHCAKFFSPKGHYAHLLRIQRYKAGQYRRLCTNCGKVFTTAQNYCVHNKKCHRNLVK